MVNVLRFSFIVDIFSDDSTLALFDADRDDIVTISELELLSEFAVMVDIDPSTEIDGSVVKLVCNTDIEGKNELAITVVPILDSFIELSICDDTPINIDEIAELGRTTTVEIADMLVEA